MSEPFLSEILLFSFNFPPKGYAFCSGQLLPINQNQALFALLGTTYGGDGMRTFGLPNLNSRVAIHLGSGHTLGELAGEEAHTLIVGEMPAHTHLVNATVTPSAVVTNNPTGDLLASAFTNQAGNPRVNVYGPGPLTPLDSNSLGATGGSQPHENRMPFLALNYCIALQGIFPSQN